MRLNPIVFATAVLMSSYAMAQQVTIRADHPFLGSWDCEVVAFTVGPSGYAHNGMQMEFAEVDDRANDVLGMIMEDGYVVTLIERDGQLNWHSPASGDTFICEQQG